MEKTKKMVEEITQKRKLTKKVVEKINKKVIGNLLIAIGIMLYICTINFTYQYLEEPMIDITSKIFPMIFIFLTVIVFEIAYRKENGAMATFGIEFLLLSIIFLYIPQIYTNLDKIYCKVLTFIPLFVAVYYVGKSILIYIKMEKEYQNNLSDVKEILKEEVEV